MNGTVPTDPENDIPIGSPKGFIAFCETNLRYEKGYKAWIILGPYLLGAFVLERLANASGDSSAMKFAWWSVFLAYLIVFPDAWRRLLKWRNSPKPLSQSRASEAQ